MNIVEPIRSKTKINEIKRILEEEWKYRDLFLFVFWMNSWLRISDLLKFKVSDFLDENLHLKKSISIKEKKTWKYNSILINTSIKNAFALFIKHYKIIGLKTNSFIFFNSRQLPIWSKAINRRTTYMLINKYCRRVWLLNEKYWNHTLRKTWWYHARKSGIPLYIIQEKLNHSSLSITKRYLWITKDEIEEECKKLEL